MKSSQELLNYVEKSGYKTRYGSDGGDTMADMLYAVSLSETAIKQHAEMWHPLHVDPLSESDVNYQKAVQEIYQFLTRLKFSSNIVFNSI